MTATFTISLQGTVDGTVQTVTHTYSLGDPALVKFFGAFREILGNDPGPPTLVLDADVFNAWCDHLIAYATAYVKQNLVQHAQATAVGSVPAVSATKVT